MKKASNIFNSIVFLTVCAASMYFVIGDLKQETDLLTLENIVRIVVVIGAGLGGLVSFIKLLAELYKLIFGIKETVKLDSEEDFRHRQVSFLRAYSRVSSRIIKKNFYRLYAEIAISFIFGASVLGILGYAVYTDNQMIIEALSSYQFIFYLGIISIFFSIACFVELMKYVINFKRFSDFEFSVIEEELDRPSTIKYPNNLYLTDNYIIKLYKEYTGAKAKNDVFTFMVKYSEVEWAFESIIGFEQSIIKDNVGVSIFGRAIGKKGIFRASNSAANRRYVGEILDFLAKKNPDIRLGFTEENRNYFENCTNLPD